MVDAHLCSKCGETKALEEFYVRKRDSKANPWCRSCYREWHRNRYAPLNGETGEERGCVSCGKTFSPKQRRVAMYCSSECKGRHRKESGRGRETYLNRTYGISSAVYDEMLEAQGGGCALCGATPETQRAKYKTYLHVDHCHDTGRVRGLLCGEHNLLLGRFGDSATLLRKAADYIEGQLPRNIHCRNPLSAEGKERQS